jgi:hypothetical protein
MKIQCAICDDNYHIHTHQYPEYYICAKCNEDQTANDMIEAEQYRKEVIAEGAPTMDYLNKF